MARVVVVTNPSHDIATEYLDAWLGLVHDENGKNGLEVHELKKENVTKEEFEKLVLDKKPHLILFNGHGSHDSIYGFNTNVLIQCGENVKLLENRIVHSLACESGKTLGPESVKIGSLAFIGFKDEFKFVHLNKSDNAGRLADDVAGFFFKPVYEAIITLIKGGTAEDSFVRSQSMHMDMLRSLLTSGVPTFNTMIASRVYHNLINQVQLGDKKASF